MPMGKYLPSSCVNSLASLAYKLFGDHRCGLLLSPSYGFAAGCEAVAMPAVEMPFTFLGYAPGAAFGPINPEG